MKRTAMSGNAAESLGMNAIDLCEKEEKVSGDYRKSLHRKVLNDISFWRL